MTVLTLPLQSRTAVFGCIALQAFALYTLASYQHRSFWLCVVAFFTGGFLTDWISGLAHFGFDYV